jgi:hypothetical protein
MKWRDTKGIYLYLCIPGKWFDTYPWKIDRHIRPPSLITEAEKARAIAEVLANARRRWYWSAKARRAPMIG